MVALKTLIFTILVPGTVVIFVPYRLLPSDLSWSWTAGGMLRYLGLPLILLGVALYLRSAWGFTFVGRGTPAPIDPPRALVAQGVYRFVRNPMYVAVIAVLLGEAVLFESLRLVEYAALVFLAFHSFVVLYEEPTLKRKFGASYERYCNEVPRWFPRLKRQSRPPRPV